MSEVSLHRTLLIVSQILPLLSPIDVLYFSWTCKAAYTLLQSKELRFVWKRARANFKDGYVPYPPHGLQESTYARLLFHRKCSVCFKRWNTIV